MNFRDTQFCLQRGLSPVTGHRQQKVRGGKGKALGPDGCMLICG